MNVRQRRAITDARIMVVAQEQVAIIFASSDQPAAIEAAIEAVQGEPIEVVRGCVRVFEAIRQQVAAFS